MKLTRKQRDEQARIAQNAVFIAAMSDEDLATAEAFYYIGDDPVVVEQIRAERERRAGD